MEPIIQISKLNDYLFCPYSLYLKSIYENISEVNYHTTYQVNGKLKHRRIDNQEYSSSKNIIESIPIYSEKYKLIGKIDLYDKSKKYLIERKSMINKIYEGYILQLHAQYLCLKEMGYTVEKIFLHSLENNKRYSIPLPTKKDIKQITKIIKNIQNIEYVPMNINPNKCNKCIYKTLCEYDKHK